MPELPEIQARLGELRQDRDDTRAALRSSVLAERELAERIAREKRRTAPRDPDGQGRIEGLERELEVLRRRTGQRREDLGAAVSLERQISAELLALQPQEAIRGLDDRLPILLLPVHIETKFVGAGQGATELLVRVHPDDIALAAHDSTLSAGELADGIAYWKARAAAQAGPDAQTRANELRGAWNLLAMRHDAHRASWIARATRPDNWQDDASDPDALVFPALETKPIDATAVPRSFVLPDRFVFILTAGSNTREVVGNLIPDDLALGPDPIAVEGLFERDEDTGRIVVDDAMRWLVDFPSAVTAGMALRIPLLPQETNGFDRIVVLGLRTSSSAADSAQRLQRLVEAHYFGEGMAIVPQGTPTNNTDAARSGFTSSNEAAADTLFQEQSGPGITPTDDHLEKTDGQRLAEALALPLETIAALPNAGRMDVAEGIAMNRALWGATLGGFLNDLMKPAIDDTTIGRTQRFFTAFVLGRGLLPALRVGEQPYGVLITSSFQRFAWTQAETGDEAGFWAGLDSRLRTLERVWRERLLPQVAFAGKPAADPFQNLLQVVGLQASSVEYHVRKGIYDTYLWNYLNFHLAATAFATNLWERLLIQKGENFTHLRLVLPMLPAKYQSFTFLRDSDAVPGPVIDGDPAIPFSEAKEIRAFNATQNYIDWLVTSPAADIHGEVFRNAEGNRIDAPAALLYQLLRHAYVSELGRSGIGLVKAKAAHIFAELPEEPPILNVNPATLTFSTRDVLQVDSARIGVTKTAQPVGDYLLAEARLAVDAVLRAPEAANLADQTEALRMLARLPTARLERCLAEHLDVCGYRLDAWLQGLFARRLALLRRSQRQQQGTWLGMYGWVENVRPASAQRRVVPAESIPEPFREERGPLVEYANSGGFVHAPSLTHAATAAVLRNAYLTHADDSAAGTMAVHLSSERVRRALSFIEGMRNGQELAALLGYQIERGLHENHPGVELDEFIYVLRDFFPFVSKKITPVPDGTAAELVEARQVINGYDLLDFVSNKKKQGRVYPYDLTGLPTTNPQARAVNAEIDALFDSMDAVGDLVLAEGVHQVVQGNYDRAKGILQAAGEGGAPPDIEVITTPRSGRTLTQRVALHLDPAETDGWQAVPSPRAQANAPLNHWLREQLPAPADVQWQVTLAGASQFVSLESLGMEPLDVVLMSGPQLGDFSSELERVLVYAYRRNNGVSDQVVSMSAAQIDAAVPVERRLLFDYGAAGPGAHPLAAIWPLFETLRALVSECRPLNAQDHALPAEASDLDPANPKGFDDGAPPLADLQELADRIEDAHAALAGFVRTQLEAFLTATVQPLYEAFKNDPARTIDPQWPAHLDTVRALLEAIVLFGVPEALPTAGFAVTELNIDALVAQAEAIVKMLNRRLDDARARLDLTFTDPLPADPAAAARERARRTEARVASFTEAAQALLGRAFIPLPLFRLHPDQRAELTSALLTPIASSQAAVENWLSGLVRVRPGLAHLHWLFSYAEWVHDQVRALRPVQLPVRAGDRWIGEEYGAHLGPGDVLSIALLQQPPALEFLQCGLLLDEWTEVVPAERETTGIAVHANRPNAVAPQALLLCVAPQLHGSWVWDDLVAVVSETLERARLRAVEPDLIAGTEYFQLLPTVLTEFGTGSVLVSTEFNRNLVTHAVANPG